MKIKLDEGAKMPTRAHPYDAGLDLYAKHDITVPGAFVDYDDDEVCFGSATIDTGVHVQIPEGCVGFVKSKSGLMVNHGITTDGTIDCGYTGSSCGDPADAPLSTVTVQPRHGVVAAHIQKYYGGVIGRDVAEPMPTITAVDHNAICAAHIAKFRRTEVGTAADDPIPTLTATPHFAVCTAVLAKADGRDLGYWPQVRALLNKHCGYELKDDKVILLIIGGIAYYISDIELRMLVPREQYAAMAFPPDYAIERDYLGNAYPKNQQTAKCGNAVSPVISYAMVRANLPEWNKCKLGTMAQFHNAVAV